MATAKKPAAKQAGGGAARKGSFPDKRLENTEPGHSKFWTIHLEDTSTTIHYGKIGEDPGRVSGPKDHKIRKRAEAFYTKQIASKIKKGYHDAAANAEADETEPTAGTKRKIVTAAPKRKAQKQEIDTKHFAWGFSGGNSEILADGLVFRKDNGRETAGVRSKEPLPKRIAWSVSWSVLGSHQAVGVADAFAPCLFEGYGYVFGEETDTGQSWALCFTRALDQFHVRHEGHEVEVFPSDVKPKQGMPLEVVLRREESKLYVQLPGSRDEHLIFSDLPDTDLFAVASTPYNTCQIVIQDPANPQRLPDPSVFAKKPNVAPAPAISPRPSPPKKPKKTYPECPAFDAIDIKESVKEVMAGVGDGKWGLELVEKTDLMWTHHGKFLAPDEKQKADVGFVMSHGLAFREASSLEECFSELNCDDGIISCYKLKCAVCESMSLTYYEGGFGGNSHGWLLVDEQGVTKFLVSNCDEDIAWEGPDKSSHAAKKFKREFTRIRYD